MKTTLNEKIIAYLALLSGLTISAVAVYYSVSGLTAIFAAATIPIIVMGVSLEVSKIVASVWLKQNWKMAPKLVKLYLCIAVALLMVITSMGIFGFLSAAHLNQNMPSAEAAANIALIDEKILTEKSNIEANQKVINQLDNSVNQIIGRSTDERGAARSLTVRRSQQKERAGLASEISASQKQIAVLNLEKAPIAVTLRKVEAEVGPIKYIAAFFYGSSDPAILEKAVTWVIILIIVVFDPLALILLIASQVSFQEFRRNAALLESMPKDAPVIEPTVPAEPIAVVEPEPVVEIEEVIAEVPVILPVILEVENQEPAPASEVPIDFTEIIPVLEDEFDACPSCYTEMVEVPSVGIVCPNPSCATSEHADENNTIEPAEVVWPQLISTDDIGQSVENVFTRQSPPAPALLEEPSIYATPAMSYVQNEEQGESGLWSSTTSKTISHEEYMNASQEKLEDYIAEVVKQVRSGQLQMSEVPDILLAEVKTRI